MAFTNRILDKVKHEPNFKEFQLLETAATLALQDISATLEAQGDDVLIHEFHILENYILVLEKSLENLLTKENV